VGGGYVPHPDGEMQGHLGPKEKRVDLGDLLKTLRRKKAGLKGETPFPRPKKEGGKGPSSWGLGAASPGRLKVLSGADGSS